MIRWYQSEACVNVWSHLRTQETNPVVVMPTGSGKSYVIAELCRQVIAWRGRVVVLAHRKELLQQNAEKIRLALPELDIGVYSAGLRSRDIDHDVIVAGIQSCFRRALEFGERQLVIVDEAHLIPSRERELVIEDDGHARTEISEYRGMYLRFIDQAVAGNKWLRVVGLTATPYRLQDGPIIEGDIFKTICYETPIQQLISEGFLCKLTTTRTSTVDMKDVHTKGGEFIPAEAEAAFMAGTNIERHTQEMIANSTGRKAILVFCSGVKHALEITLALQLSGERAECVVGDTTDLFRAQNIAGFKSGALRWLVNCNVLTTGFDAPNIDCIAVVRATKSPGLFAQMCGRGFRVCEGKADCLILDFGGNIRRHGALDDPQYGKAKIKGSQVTDDISAKRDAAKEQEEDEHDPNDIMMRDELGQSETLEQKADAQAKILSEPQSLAVEEVSMYRHPGRDGKPDTLCVVYGLDATWPNQVREWICIEHRMGWAAQKARQWWARHSQNDCPQVIEEAILLWKLGAMRMPNRVIVVRDGKYWRVLDRKFEAALPSAIDLAKIDAQQDAASDLFEDAPF